MKSTLLMILTLLTLASCGQYAKQTDMDNLEERVTTTEVKISDLENKVSANLSSISNLAISADSSSEEIAALNEALAQSNEETSGAILALITQHSANYNSLNAIIETLQGQTTSLLAKQASLELEDRVVGIFDPCPTVSSTKFKESFFEMSSGKLVAYFEDGNKRFLTVLKTGTSYRTTDSRACLFTL